MTAKNILEMSDEEVMNMTSPPTAETSEETTTTEVTETTDDTSSVEAKSEVNEPKGGTPEGSKTDDAGEDAEEKTETTASTEEKVEEVKEKSTESSTEAEATTTEKAIDYEAEYKKLLAPFKANGREIKVDSVEDAINLMQMGANYNKKMAALKPNLKLMKMLENNGLLSEEKLSFLIDLDKKNPGAIQKLVKESGIDPMDFDADKASAYKQTAYAVDERELALDEVLDEIQNSPNYTKTLDVVSNKWDAASKQVVAQAPQLLKVIDDHINRGIYDIVSAEVERERLFGRLKGMSDLEAYKTVGDAIQARGGFNHLAPNQPGAGSKSPGTPNPPAKTVIVPPKPKADDSKLNDKRRAAAPTKVAAPSTAPAEFNPLALSDEEFSKLSQQRYR